MSPTPAMPTTSEENTSGMTIISSSRRNNSPIGSVNCATNHSTRGLLAPNKALTATPDAAPMNNPSRMRVCNMDGDLSLDCRNRKKETHQCGEMTGIPERDFPGNTGGWGYASHYLSVDMTGCIAMGMPTVYLTISG